MLISNNEIFFIHRKMATVAYGHRWLIDQRLNSNYNVCIAIRDMETDTNNPLHLRG